MDLTLVKEANAENSIFQSPSLLAFYQGPRVQGHQLAKNTQLKPKVGVQSVLLNRSKQKSVALTHRDPQHLRISLC